jgi:chromosome segregation ATPase
VEWKAIGPAPKEVAEGIWQTFRGAANRFFERRKEHYAELEKQLLENLEKKEALCVRAEELAGSTDWKSTAEAFKSLQEEWKAIGPVPRAKSDAVWQRFRGAANQFFEKRKEHYRELERDQKENLRKKEALCVQAEELAGSTEWRSTVQAIKALQAEWKAIGPVPKSKSDVVWARFRGAIDQFFARQAAYFEERDQRQGERKNQMQEALTRKREQADRLRDSIARDDENLERWRTSLADVHPSANDIRANLEGKIADVEARKSEKVKRLEELDAAVKDIEAKL